ALNEDIDDEVKAVLKDWLDNKEVGEGSRERADKVIKVLEEDNSEICKIILSDKEFLVKRSQWIFGGDGWAYDIGYGGLDHVLASNENINVLVFDTEV
ncbi:Pyruvate-flavodoxin oxidoreductase, partial [human gut metagenome]